MAKMLQAAEIKQSDRVLVVGCATGYAAAVVAQFAAACERHRERSGLASKAQAILANLAVET